MSVWWYKCMHMHVGKKKVLTQTFQVDLLCDFGLRQQLLLRQPPHILHLDILPISNVCQNLRLLFPPFLSWQRLLRLQGCGPAHGLALWQGKWKVKYSSRFQPHIQRLADRYFDKKKKDKKRKAKQGQFHSKSNLVNSDMIISTQHIACMYILHTKLDPNNDYM